MTERRAVKDWIGRTPDARPPSKVRLRVFLRHKGRCHLSGLEIKPGDKWDLDHVIAICNGGANAESNLAPALRAEHRQKTKADVAERARVDHRAMSNIGIREATARLPGSRLDAFKLAVGGGTKPREKAASRHAALPRRRLYVDIEERT